MIKGFNLFLKFGFYSFFVANSVNIHKKNHLGSLLEMVGRGKDSVQKLTKCQVLNGGKNHHGGEKHLCNKKRPLYGVF